MTTRGDGRDTVVVGSRRAVARERSTVRRPRARARSDGLREGRNGAGRHLRADILRAATEEFGARGYRSTNLRHVATRLGVTRQALYHYFPRKHDILVTLYTDYFDELEENLRRASTGVAQHERFRAMFRSHIELMAARPWISQIFERESGQLPKRAAEVMRERRRALHDLFVSAYADGVKAGVLRPLDGKLVVSIVLGVPGWLHRWYKRQGRLRPRDLGAHAEDLLFSGLRAEGRARARARTDAAPACLGS